MKSLILILGEQKSIKDEIFQMLKPNNESQLYFIIYFRIFQCLLTILTQFDFLPYFIYQSQTQVMCFPGLTDLKSEMLQIIYKFSLIFNQIHIGFVIQKQNQIEINEEIENIKKQLIDNQQDKYQNTQKYASFFYFCDQEQSQSSIANVHKINIKEQQKSKQYLKKWLDQTQKEIQCIKLDSAMLEFFQKQVEKEFQKLNKQCSKVLQQKEDLLLKSLATNTGLELVDFDDNQYYYQSEIFSNLLLLNQNFKNLRSYCLFLYFLSNLISLNLFKSFIRHPLNFLFFFIFKQSDELAKLFKKIQSTIYYFFDLIQIPKILQYSTYLSMKLSQTIFYTCKELSFSHDSRQYGIKFDNCTFQLYKIEKQTPYCSNSSNHYLNNYIQNDTLKQVITNKFLKQYQELQMKKLNASQQIEEEKCTENQLPILLIGNNDYSRNYLISKLCQLSDQRDIQKKNQSFTKYFVNESKYAFYNTQNYDTNSDAQISEFSKFFASQPIKFIFYVFELDRLDIAKTKNIFFLPDWKNKAYFQLSFLTLRQIFQQSQMLFFQALLTNPLSQETGYFYACTCISKLGQQPLGKQCQQCYKEQKRSYANIYQQLNNITLAIQFYEINSCQYLSIYALISPPQKKHFPLI